MYFVTSFKLQIYIIYTYCIFVFAFDQFCKRIVMLFMCFLSFILFDCFNCTIATVISTTAIVNRYTFAR